VAFFSQYRNGFPLYYSICVPYTILNDFNDLALLFTWALSAIADICRDDLEKAKQDHGFRMSADPDILAA